MTSGKQTEKVPQLASEAVKARARHVLLRDEPVEEYVGLVEGVLRRLAPSCPAEEEIAMSIADLFHRAKRLSRLEKQVHECEAAAGEPAETGHVISLDKTQQFERSLREWNLLQDALGKLSRYDTSNMKKIEAMLALYEKFRNLPKPAPTIRQGVLAPPDADVMKKRIEESMQERYPR